MTLRDELETDPLSYGLSGISNQDIEATLNAKTRTRVVETRIGYGTVLSVLGAEEGAAVLDKLEALSTTNSPVKWAMKLLAADNLNIADPQTQLQIDGLASAGVMSLGQALLLKGLALRMCSRAEELGLVVNDFEIRLARG